MCQTHPDATTAVRIYRSEAQLIRLGLESILVRHNLHEAGILRSVSLLIVFWERHFDRGEFASDQMLVINRSIDKTHIVTRHGRRLRLDAVEIAACMFAVRVTGTLLRHGHMQPWQPGLPAAIRRLVRKLEIHRKRATRAYIN